MIGGHSRRRQRHSTQSDRTRQHRQQPVSPAQQNWTMLNKAKPDYPIDYDANLTLSVVGGRHSAATIGARPMRWPAVTAHRG